MAKRKTAVTETANTVATGNKKATKQAAKSSPAPATKKAEKTPKEVVQKPPLETKTVCFTDKDSGKKFCGEMTEVPASKETAKVAGTKRRAALRRRKR